ncbi:hypothetical protein Hanom_Chr02g00157021 [Helianthus anomalus]
MFHKPIQISNHLIPTTTHQTLILLRLYFLLLLLYFLLLLLLLVIPPHRRWAIKPVLPDPDPTRIRHTQKQKTKKICGFQVLIKNHDDPDEIYIYIYV